jgi:hypothetical protein
MTRHKNIFLEAHAFAEGFFQEGYQVARTRFTKRELGVFVWARS